MTQGGQKNLKSTFHAGICILHLPFALVPTGNRNPVGISDKKHHPHLRGVVESEFVMLVSLSWRASVASTRCSASARGSGAWPASTVHQSVLRGGPEVGFRDVEIDDFDREVGIFLAQSSRSVGSPSDGTWNPANRNAGATFPDATPKRAGSPKYAGKKLTHPKCGHFRLFFSKSMEMMGGDRNLGGRFLHGGKLMDPFPEPVPEECCDFGKSEGWG